MKRYELIVIGAGPAGLCAAIEAAKSGMSVIVFDENARPGGQLFKQIHKFFRFKGTHGKNTRLSDRRDALKRCRGIWRACLPKRYGDRRFSREEGHGPFFGSHRAVQR